MTAEELRLGNYVRYDGFIATVFELGHDEPMIEFEEDGGRDNVFYSEIKPIKLTKKWFLKFGFERHRNNLPKGESSSADLYIDYWEIQMGSFPNVCALTINAKTFRCEFGDLGSRRIYLPVKIDSVHKLQNLYFDLSGSKLIEK